MVNDPHADYDSLYLKKILYEPTGILSSISMSPQNVAELRENSQVSEKRIDMPRLLRLSKVSGHAMLKRNFDQILNYIIQMV